ncbi:MAG: hypothetical protein HC848_09425 [Limnobacter sp.]|nr:hypothetical protein [Limnobacter sp.]
MAVEEQFYLIYPFAFLVFYRFRHAKWMPWAVVAGFAASLILLGNTYETTVLPAMQALAGLELSGKALWGPGTT